MSGVQNGAKSKPGEEFPSRLWWWQSSGAVRVGGQKPIPGFTALFVVEDASAPSLS
jgi:hypothetical protein